MSTTSNSPVKGKQAPAQLAMSTLTKKQAADKIKELLRKEGFSLKNYFNFLGIPQNLTKVNAAQKRNLLPTTGAGIVNSFKRYSLWRAKLPKEQQELHDTGSASVRGFAIIATDYQEPLPSPLPQDWELTHPPPEHETEKQPPAATGAQDADSPAHQQQQQQAQQQQAADQCQSAQPLQVATAQNAQTGKTAGQKQDSVKTASLDAAHAQSASEDGSDSDTDSDSDSISLTSSSDSEQDGPPKSVASSAPGSQEGVILPQHDITWSSLSTQQQSAAIKAGFAADQDRQASWTHCVMNNCLPPIFDQD